jgi:hypothetical protein
VLQYGGGVVVEVLASGKARWLYGTQQNRIGIATGT